MLPVSAQEDHPSEPGGAGWGLFLVLAVVLAAGGVYALVRREDDWMWDAVKAFGFAAACAAFGLDRFRWSRRAG